MREAFCDAAGAVMHLRDLAEFLEPLERESRQRGEPIRAVARRMLEDAFTMLKRDEAFRYVEPPAASLPAPTSSSDRKVASSVAG